MSKPFPLNAGQQAAADGVFQFLFSEERELNISGPGGVGKTFLMGHLIDEIIPQYQKTCQMLGIPPGYDEVVMTATTNKAADVLGRATGRPTQTTHSFFNLKVQDDYSTGRSNIIKTRSWKVHQNKIIFIDECSMVDRQLLAMIREGTSKCKVIFVGDHCQLAPVHEPISPVYNQGLPFFELTEPMRTDNPILQALNAKLRETVKTGIFQPIKVVPGILDHLDDDQMEQTVNHLFQNDAGPNRILAYTNQRVVDYNDHIRMHRKVTEPYVEGEVLINNSAIQFPTGMLSVEEEVTLMNVATTTHFIDIEDGVNLECRRADLHTAFGGVFADVSLPEDRNHMTALISHYRRQKNWPKYYNLKNHFPDLRQRDASTVHKSQGSSHDYVFIDLGNISTCHNANQVARMLYVAFSRARHGVYMYGDLAKKYGGLVY